MLAIALLHLMQFLCNVTAAATMSSSAVREAVFWRASGLSLWTALVRYTKSCVMLVTRICNRVLCGEPSPQPLSRRCVHVFRICNGVLRGESSAHLLFGFDDTQMMSNLCSQGSHVLFVCPLSSHRIPPNSLFSRLRIFVSLFSLLVWSLWKAETMAQSDESDQPTRVVVSSGSWTLDTSDTPPFESVDLFTTCVRARCWGNSGTSQPKAGDSFPSRCDAPSTSSWSDFE